MAVISNATTIADAGAFSVNLGSMVLIKTLTASSSANLAFVNGASSVVLDGTYPTYMFKFINIHPATDDVFFQFNGSDDTSSHAYNITKTTTNFSAEHNEGDSVAQLGYVAGDDLAQAPRAPADTDLDGLVDISITTDQPIVITDHSGKDIGVVSKDRLLRGIQGGK